MAVKKKAAAKAKTAKKTSQKTATTRKAARKAPARKTVTVVFQCIGGTCTPSADPAHAKKGDTVVMEARGTKVDIDFFRTSPFTLKFFSIASGKTVSATVMKSRGRFPYNLTCGACLGSAVPPEFIVP